MTWIEIIGAFFDGAAAAGGILLLVVIALAGFDAAVAVLRRLARRRGRHADFDDFDEADPTRADG